jgi:hypothetical protein
MVEQSQEGPEAADDDQGAHEAAELPARAGRLHDVHGRVTEERPRGGGSVARRHRADRQP